MERGTHFALQILLILLLLILSLRIAVFRVDNLLILLMFELHKVHFLQPATVMTHTDDPNLYFIVDVLVSHSLWIFQHNCIDFEYGFVFLVVQV